ncbi:MAG TPA: hypothetical protein V6C81_32465 [Planktothrix sp.]|jgi:hypothetical protein
MKNNGNTAEFPYRMLLRWSWPEHIEKLIRRSMWLWLVETAKESSDGMELELLGAHVCWLIAVHPDSPPAVLDALALQDSTPFCERIAENPNAWPTTLADLSHHRSASVRAAVAENPNTPPDIVTVLAQDESADVRFAVADNPKHAVALLEALTRDENCHVAERSKRTLQQLCPADTRKLVAKNSGSPRKMAKG